MEQTMSATKNLIGAAAGAALVVAPFAHAVTANKDSARPEDPTKAAIAMGLTALSTATNTPLVIFNAITDDEYSVEPPGERPQVTWRST
jgi:hypothetical protein